MSKILILSITLLFSSCATYHPPEAFEAKMNRFSARSGQKNTVPDIYTQPLLLKASRAPASISPKQKSNHSTTRIEFCISSVSMDNIKHFGTTPPHQLL